MPSGPVQHRERRSLLQQLSLGQVHWRTGRDQLFLLPSRQAQSVVRQWRLRPVWTRNLRRQCRRSYLQLVPERQVLGYLWRIPKRSRVQL